MYKIIIHIANQIVPNNLYRINLLDCALHPFRFNGKSIIAFV